MESTYEKPDADQLLIENEQLRAILNELVTLKDVVKVRDPVQYEIRKIKAWRTARDLLGRPQPEHQGPPGRVT